MFTIKHIEILNKLDRVHSITANSDPAIPTGETGLAIDRANKFGLSSVTSIYKRAAANPVKETSKLTLPDTLNAGLYRLSFNLTLAGSEQRGDFARFMVYKGRPITIEFNLNSNVTVSTGFAPYLAKINKYLSREEIIDAVGTLATEATKQVITFTAGDEYIRFTNINLELYNTTTLAFEPYLSAVVATSQNEGFGTYEYMNRYISMPTDAKNTYLALRKDGVPVSGFKYNQYTINYTKDYEVPTGIVAGVMQKGSGILVLFVREDLVTSFESMITTSLPGKMVTI